MEKSDQVIILTENKNVTYCMNSKSHASTNSSLHNESAQGIYFIYLFDRDRAHSSTGKKEL